MMNQLEPQKRTNRRKDASSVKTWAANQAKNSCGRTTVLDVPAMSKHQPRNATTHKPFHRPIPSSRCRHLTGILPSFLFGDREGW